MDRIEPPSQVTQGMLLVQADTDGLRGSRGLCWLSVLGALLLALVAGSLGAQPPGGGSDRSRESVETGRHMEHPWLWVIERDPPCFLFGTIHVPDPRVTRLPATALSALQASDSVYTEVPLDLLTKTSAGLKVFDFAGPGLKGQLPPALYARSSALLESRGLSMAGFEKMRVWGFMAALPMLDYAEAGLSATSLDEVVFTRGQRLRKKVGGIETIDEQFGYFQALSLDDQIHLLGKAIDSLEEEAASGSNHTEELLQSYMAADEAALVAFASEEMDLSDAIEKRFYDDILIKRNKVMARRVAEKMREHPERAFFFAFGALHFPGENGIVDLLQRDGWTVARVQPGAQFAPRTATTPTPQRTPTALPTSPLNLPRSKQSNPFAP